MHYEIQLKDSKEQGHFEHFSVLSINTEKICQCKQATVTMMMQPQRRRRKRR